MGGQPVQILRVKEGERVEVNETALQRILLADHVKNRPVVVISVAGGNRQGKSFLLSFFLRYLRNSGRSNWMKDTDAPLHGFEWGPGRRRETKGIMLWNEVFLMTDSNGEEVAVLLMDTQGTCDSESTMTESTTIFSLSMMTSSVQIYNVMHNIKEYDLEHLQFFAEYGQLAEKGNKTQAFQKLLFLVRDWSWPHEFEYGFRGGRSLIATRLKITHGQAAELTTLWQNIMSCFSDIDCFLMPEPGKKVVRETSFDGRLADIDEEFREKLLELIPSVLAPENLMVKQVNGKKLTCEHLMTFFTTYVEVFKEGDLPVPTSKLLATAKATIVDAMDKARKHYMSGMANRPRRNLDRLREFHREKLADAKKVFNDFLKLGGDAMSCTFMDVLIMDLEELFDHFFKEEEEIIKKEQEEEATQWREWQEERKREGQRKRERILENLRAEAKEAEMKREIELMKEMRRKMEEELFRARERAAQIEREKHEMSRKVEELAKKCEDLEKIVTYYRLMHGTVRL